MYKKLRLKIIQLVMEETDNLDINLLQTLLPEIILATKEVNAKTRDVAMKVICSLVRLMLRSKF